MNARTPATAALAFMPCGPVGQSLFAVRADVSTTDALDRASALLAAALETSRSVAGEVGTDGAYAATYLIEMAKAVVDAAACGLVDERGGA